MCSESADLSQSARLIAALCAALFVASAAAGLYFSARYLLSRKGTRALRVVKTLYSIASTIVAALYSIYSLHAFSMQMLEAGVALSLGFLGFHLVVTAGMIVNGDK